MVIFKYWSYFSEEEGVYYALDLGGTNFRVLRVQLGGKNGGILNQEFMEATIPPEMMVGEADVSSRSDCSYSSILIQFVKIFEYLE